METKILLSNQSNNIAVFSKQSCKSGWARIRTDV